MRRALAIASLFCSVAAFAGWKPQIATFNQPKEVTAVDGGFLVSGQAGVTRYVCTSTGCTPTQLRTASFISAVEDERGCIAMMPATGGTLDFVPAGCGTAATIGTGGRRMQLAPGGAGFLIGRGVVAGSFTALWTPSLMSPWAMATTPMPVTSSATTEPLSTATVAGRDLALIAPINAGQARAAVIADGGGMVSNFSLATTSVPADLQLFDNGGRASALIVVDPGGGARLRYVSDVLAPTLESVGPTLNLSAVELVTQGAGDAGVGFSMLSAQNATLYGATPNPQRIGLDWVTRTNDTGVSFSMIACRTPELCLAISPSPGSVWLYSNDELPQVPNVAFTVDEGETRQILTGATDLDGDPVFVNWPTTSGALTFNTDGGSGTGALVSVGFTDAGTCAPVLQTATVRVSDGWGVHDRAVSLSFTINRGMRPPEPPTVAPTMAMTSAGGADVSFTATAAPMCQTTGFAWSYDGGIGGSLAFGGGPMAVFTPPATLCNGDGGTAAIHVWNIGAGGPSTPATASVFVTPWGRASTPLFAPSMVTQTAGTTQSYSPQAGSGHACVGSPGFPGLTSQWSVVGDAGQVQVSFSGDTATVVSGDDCAGGSFDLQLTQAVIGMEATSLSPPATLGVTVDVTLQPVTAATPFDAGFRYDDVAALASGTFTVGVNCAVARGLLAEVSIESTDGTRDAGRASGLVVPGPWSLAVPGGCSGGDYRFVATLLDGAQRPLGPTDVRTFSTTRLAAGVGELSATTLPVVCGAGLDAELSVAPAAGACGASGFTWQQTGGPALKMPQLEGATVRLVSSSAELDELVGQTVTFSIEADAGFGNVGARDGLSVQLVTDPFVAVQHVRAPPQGTVDGLVTMQLQLENQSDCASQKLSLAESLDGLVYVPGSARLDGVAIDASSEGGVLQVPTLELPSHQRRSFTYVARGSALRTARPTAVASLSGVPVSFPEEAPVATGCGCSEAGTGACLFAALTLLLRARTRRFGYGPPRS